MTKKLLIKKLYDFLGVPLRLVILPDRISEKIGMTSLQQERVNNILPFIEGKLLDIGCGNNRLVKTYGNGTGVDVFDWGGDARIVIDTSDLPFRNESFYTITFVASLNHIPNRDEIVIEAYRVLKGNGKVIVTMINPLLGYIGHKIWWYSEDKERGMEVGEMYGLWKSDVIRLFQKHGFFLEIHKRFVYWMNNFFVFRKKKNVIGDP